MKRSEFLRLAWTAPMALWAGTARGQEKSDFGGAAEAALGGYEGTQAAIAAMLTSPERLPLPLQRVRQALKAHYVDNGGTIYWAGTGRMTPFLQRLGKAAEDGLNPDDYPIEPLASLRDSANDGDAAMMARAELYYSAFFLAYASDLKIGRVIPSKIDPRLFRTRKTIDLLRVLTDLKKQREPSKFLAAFEPRNPHYRALKAGLRVYRAKGEGEWPAVAADGAVIKPGASDPRIPRIRQILQATGDYEWTGSGALYDEQLAIAVKRFQGRHGLEAKGNIGKQTLLALNVPPSERAKQIMLNMERWRWMPESLGAYHFLVNIAGFELHRVQENTIVERMPVVTGAVATQTPEFSDELEYIEFNPTWTVPYSIATKEMLPKLRGNPMAYAADFEVFQAGKVVSWRGIAWSAYGPGNFPFTFRQKPGPKNALGKVKFMLPNKHNIYLHDTPAKDKFGATSRAFSHGCIRLSKPIDLAYTLAVENCGWSEGQVTAAFASGKTTRAMLSAKLPVHLIYATAFKGDGGEIEFRPDVYGRDRKLYNALFAQPTA
jgi:murein L,D-transpeptidase YcbB/YkuD